MAAKDSSTGLMRPQSPEELRDIFASLRDPGREISSIPLPELLAPLDRLASLWRPGSDYYRQACDLLSGRFTRRAVESALQNLAFGLTKASLTAELHRELGRADLLDSWQPDELGIGYVRGYPLGVTAHVLAGNVFLGGVIALAQSLLTRNAVLLKLSRDDSGFTALFAETLRQMDETAKIAAAVAVCTWDSQQDELNEVIRTEADGIVVWGGSAAIAAYPADRCRGRVIHYGPRLGIGLVLTGTDLHQALPALAWDIALWEQQACSSPRLLLVERHGSGDAWPRQVAEGLSTALGRIHEHLPARPMSLDEKAEVCSIRELAWWTERADVFHENGVATHTVLMTAEIPHEVPIGYRTVLVIPFQSHDQLSEMLRPLRPFLQTAVLAAPAPRWNEGVDSLVRSGLTQVTAPGAASARVMGLPHEGEFALRRLVKLVGIDLGAGALAYPHRDPASPAAIAGALTSRQ